MILYSLDTLFFLFTGSHLEIVLHVLVIAGIYKGYRATTDYIIEASHQQEAVNNNDMKIT